MIAGREYNRRASLTGGGGTSVDTAGMATHDVFLSYERAVGAVRQDRSISAVRTNRSRLADPKSHIDPKETEAVRRKETTEWTRRTSRRAFLQGLMRISDFRAACIRSCDMTLIASSIHTIGRHERTSATIVLFLSRRKLIRNSVWTTK